MIEKNEFPFSLGGYGWQEEYKGFDIVVHVQKHKGISLTLFLLKTYRLARIKNFWR